MDRTTTCRAFQGAAGSLRRRNVRAPSDDPWPVPFCTWPERRAEKIRDATCRCARRWRVTRTSCAVAHVRDTPRTRLIAMESQCTGPRHGFAPGERALRGVTAPRPRGNSGDGAYSPESRSIQRGVGDRASSTSCSATCTTGRDRWRGWRRSAVHGADPADLRAGARSPSIPRWTGTSRASWTRWGSRGSCSAATRWAGHVALHVALAHPERVTGLILTGPSGLFSGIAGRARIDRPPRVPGPDGGGLLRHLRRHSGLGRSRAPLVTDRDTALRVCASPRPPRATTSRPAREIRVPTLIVSARRTAITPLDAGQRSSTLIPIRSSGC